MALLGLLPEGMIALAAALAALAGLVSAAPAHHLDGPLLRTATRDKGLSWKPAPCRLPTQWAADVNASAPKPEYPRPQMVRDDPSLSVSLNGVWQWQQDSSQTAGPVPPGPLNGSILVPFPVESCLSGIGKNFDAMWYALRNASLPSAFAAAGDVGAMQLLLHVEASDWRTQMFVNGKSAGPAHEGGYSRFTLDITDLVGAGASTADFAAHVFDPSDSGTQPFGKQKVAAMSDPRGDHYTPSSGIWGTVWLEAVPSAAAVTGVRVTPTTTSFRLEVSAAAAGAPLGAGAAAVTVTVSDPGPGGAPVAHATGLVGVPIDVEVPSPRSLWTAETPSLYRIDVDLSAPGDAASTSDSVRTYGGLRAVSLGKDASNVTRPLLNGQPVFFNGWLDQGWWPDGQYSAPTDEALASDLAAVKAYGLNMLRKHQKVESRRFYFHASAMGVMLWQDAPQHFFGGGDFAQFLAGVEAMVDDLYSEPSVVQWVIFNERDCVGDNGFSPPEAVAAVYRADPTRLVDTNSGGPANNLGIADVNDIHHYSPPAFPSPSDSQYASLGEFGGIGYFVSGHEWAPGKCYGYADVSSSDALVTKIQGYLASVKAAQKTVSAAVYTQTTDVETECDGPLLSYDRTRKLSPAQEAALAATNRDLITGFAQVARME